MSDTYLNWVSENTSTKWWHDSAESAELDLGIERGAVGVTTNPVLSAAALQKNRALWSAEIEAVLAQKLPAEAKAEALMRIPVTKAAAKVAGVVCAQVNPLRAGDRDCMYAMAHRFHAWSQPRGVRATSVYDV